MSLEKILEEMNQHLKELKEENERLRRDVYGDPNVDMEKLVSDFLESRKGLCAENTRKAYKQDLKRFNFTAPPTLSSVSKTVSGWLSAGNSAATVQRRLSSLSKFLSRVPPRTLNVYDIREVQNYIEDFKAPAPKPSECATIEQVERLVDDSDNITAGIIGLMYFAGLRISDVQKLEPHNIHDGVIEVTTKKTGQFERIPVVKKLGSILDTYPFPDLTIRAMQNRVKVACIKNDFPALHCHAFRHGCATALAKAAAPEYIIDYVLGHVPSSSTSIYIHADDFPEKFKEWMDKAFN